ncbi:hypothetical protein [Myroides indicus]|uniref:Uncharacterized protein n=1 Tax=Myroides indicus TaxID=1323422 RepID=A0A4R7F7L8_9FLAO|nr:hypothetical protein [Myroides indicus]TDS64204.1 hypothetical protein C8P70_10553 [Myroides indicus]
MSNLNEKLSDIRENGYQLSPFNVMSEAFVYFKRSFLLITISLLTVILFLSFISSLFISRYIDADSPDLQEQINGIINLLLQPPYIYYYIIGVTILTALSSVLLAGYLKVNAEISQGKKPSFLTVFKYFVSKKGIYIFLAQLLISSVFSLITFALQLKNLQMVSMAINWLINTLTIFITPLIIFGNQKPLEAIKNSIMVVNKQPVPIILTVVLNYFLVLSGLFFFVIGFLFTLPYLFSIYFTLYKQVIGYIPEEKD